MKKWVGKIVIICFILLNMSCQKDKFETIEYNSEFLNEYKEEIKLLFGDIRVISKERISETFHGYTLIKTINYDVWEIEYMNVDQRLKYIELKNRYDFISSMSEIILYTITEEVIDILDSDIILSVYFENALENLNAIEDIDSKYYPVYLSIDNLPDDFLIIVSPTEERAKDFKDSINDIVIKVKDSNIKNVLLLEGDDAYEMDHGVLVVDGTVIQEKISVEDAVKWIESNN